MTSLNTVLNPTNGRPARFYCRKGGTEYYLEPTSGTIFQPKMPAVAVMSQYAETEYSGGVYQECAKSRDLKIATALPRLAQIKSRAKGNRLLDVGCATGFFLEAAAEQGYEIRGVEFSTVAISLARSDIREKIALGDVNTLLKQDAAKFDVVTAFDIIEHVQDPLKFLEDIYGALVPGGVLALSTPDTGHILRYLMGSKWPMLQPMQHTVLFSRRGIDELLKRCGFVDVELQTTRKFLTMDYLGDQLAATNPYLQRAYHGLKWLLPPPLRRKPIAVNIGEFAVYARKPN